MCIWISSCHFPSAWRSPLSCFLSAFATLVFSLHWAQTWRPMYVLFLLVEKVLLCCLPAHFGAHRSCSAVTSVLFAAGRVFCKQFYAFPVQYSFLQGCVVCLCECVCTCAHTLRVWCAPAFVLEYGVLFFSFSRFSSVCVALWVVSQLPVLCFPSAVSDLSQTLWFSCSKSEPLNSLPRAWTFSHLICSRDPGLTLFPSSGKRSCWHVPNGLRIVVLVFQLCRVGGKSDHYPVLIRTGSCVPFYWLSTHFIQITTSWIYTSTHVHTALILSFPRKIKHFVYNCIWSVWCSLAVFCWFHGYVYGYAGILYTYA